MTSSIVEDIDAFGGIAAILNDNSTNAYFSGSPRTDTNIFPGRSETTIDDFVIFTKNVLGMSNDDRLEEMQKELDAIQQWDIVVLSETWRKAKNEYFSTGTGDIFMNSGCEAGRRGVGFYIHRRWSNFVE